MRKKGKKVRSNSFFIKVLHRMVGTTEQAEVGPILNVTDETSNFNRFVISCSKKNPIIGVSRSKAINRPADIVVLNVSEETSAWNAQALELARREREKTAKGCLTNI